MDLCPKNYKNTMQSRDVPTSIKDTLLDYLNGERPIYEPAEFKIISFTPNVVIADAYSNTIQLNYLENEIL